MTRHFIYAEYLDWRYGISLGIHLDWRSARLDMHVLCWVLSVSLLRRLYVYHFAGGKNGDHWCLVSTSFHEKQWQHGRFNKPRR